MKKTSWITAGTDAFLRGKFGNGGQNLYVSRKGVLQRIYQYDLTHNGYMDLAFANCQNHHEAAPSFVYKTDGTKVASLPGQGSISGLAADLFDSGYTDLVVCGYYDAAAPFASTDIYWGSDEPYSENYRTRLPTPWATDVACGRFRGGKKALAFALSIYKTVRIFEQSECGFEWDKFVDLPIEAEWITAADLDGDGFDELIARKEDCTETRVYWGGPDGISLERVTELPELPPEKILNLDAATGLTSEMERRIEAPRLLRTLKVKNRTCFTRSTGLAMEFYAATKDRQLESVLEVPAKLAMAAASGDLLGDGQTEIIIATLARNEKEPTRQESYILWPDADGNYCWEQRTAFATDRAGDVCVLPNGLFCLMQGGTEREYTADSMLMRAHADRSVTVETTLSGEDSRRCAAVVNPGREPEVVLFNHFARSAVGFDKCYIYTGDKDGYSPERRIEVPCWCAVDTIYADVDDDGWAELIVCNNSENSMYLDPGHHVHHFGPGGFEPEKSYTLPVDKGWGGAVADFDHDGVLEMFSVCDTYQNLKMFKVGDDGKFHEDYLISLDGMGSPRWPIAADLNNNGYLDLVVPLISANRTLILWGGPWRYSLEHHSELAVYRGATARAADLNKNGYLDLIIGAHTLTPIKGDFPAHHPHHSWLYIYWGGPDGYQENRKTVLRGDAVDSIAVADFNNDGYLDIFAGCYHGGIDRDINSYIYWNRKGHFAELDRKTLFGHSVSGCIAADLNGDGYIDLAVANHKVWGDHKGYSEVWWNGPKGFNAERTTKLPTNGPHGMTAIEPFNIMDRGAEEFYESEPWSAPEAGEVIGAQVTAELPPQTWVNVLMRKAKTPEALNAAGWEKPEGMKFAAGDVLQYRLAVGAFNGLRSPRITQVEIKMA